MSRRLFPASILWAVLILFVCPHASSLDRSLKISQYGHSMWRIQDGYLPGPTEDIAQTKDGYLWIGTDLGLLRFDGVRFVPWAALTTEQLPDNHIFSLLGGSDGTLWIGTLKGLARWKDGHITSYKELATRINGIAEDRQGNIWIARVQATAQDQRGALCKVSDNSVQCFGQRDGIFLQSGTGTTIDAAGNIWVFGYQGLCKWKDSVVTSYVREELAGHGYLIGVAALAVKNDEHFWISLQQANGKLELREFNHGRWSAHHLPNMRGSDPSTDVMLLDAQGMLWIGTASDGVYRISADNVDHFSSADGLSSDSVLGFFEDREGILWVATTKGIDSFRQLPVVSFSIREGLASDVSSILASRDGGVWIGGAEALGFLNQDKLSAIRKNQGLPGRDITTMSEDSQGRLWIGVDTSLSVLMQGRFLPIRKPEGTPLGIILGLADDATNIEWVVTESELFGVENQKVRWRIPLPQKAFAIAADPKDGIWLGFENGDLAHHSVGHSESFPADETISSEKIRLLLPDSGGLWAVTADGLLWWTRDKRAALTTRNGLPCNELYSAVKDAEGATLSFAIAPAWYQTAAFRISCLLAGLLLLWLIYYLRMKQAARSIRARFDERIAERTRLSQDLHDTLLQTLQGSKLAADDALANHSDAEHARRTLQKLSEWIDRAMREGRAALNALQTSANDNRELFKRLQSALDECQLNGGSEGLFTVSGTPIEMDPF
jgi:ligand-binding sensor domain-containing protein